MSRSRPAWPPPWFGSITADRDDTSERVEEIFSEEMGRSGTEHDASYYPSTYSPVTLLATRPDGPDPTGPVVSIEYLEG